MNDIFQQMKNNRHSIRLKGYDYGLPGFYFITICVQNREMVFGQIVNGKMELCDVGRMVEKTWNEIPQFYCGFDVDAMWILYIVLNGYYF